MKCYTENLFGRKIKPIINLYWKTENEKLIYTTNYTEANSGVFYK